ncbi:hypothetical protein SAMN05518849_11690 [Sphingobium sp. AP50]|uniref:DUF7359 domain-containing protein n=1 Tax=Sphingobium sp. AP50 TaxID=1884369 RepID=UPI0008B379FF|nr:hypothetical protein [Sphingobium sp. AP50]SEJ87634.1 hypothetical protein SAMN05518849_11690 [Sphingobium sp. AP50]
MRATAAGVNVGGYEWLPCIAVSPVPTIVIGKDAMVAAYDAKFGKFVLRLDQAEFGNLNWRNLIWDGALVRLFSGDEGAPFASYRQEIEGFCGPASVAGINLEMEIFGPEASLAQDLLTLTYAGTGGAEGRAELKGKLKPFSIGECINVEPILIDPAYRVYQYHGYGETQDVLAIYENAVRIDGLVPSIVETYAALTAPNLLPDQWLKCPKLGMFRMGGNASGKLTADVRGAKDGTTYVNTISAIVPSLIKRAGVPAAKINQTSLNKFSGRSWSYYTAEQASIGDVARDALYQANGNLFADAQGVWRACDQSQTATAINLTRGDNVEEISRTGENPQVWNLKVGYDRVWAKHSSTEISGALKEAQEAADAAQFAADTAQDAADAAQADATLVKSRVATMSSDGWLDRSEKHQLLQMVQQFTLQKNKWETESARTAVQPPVTSERNAVLVAYNSLMSYLAGLSPAYTDTTQDTPINPAQYNAALNAFPDAVVTLTAALAKRTEYVGGEPAANIITAYNNFNNRNDRLATAVPAPTFATDGSAIEHALNTDGSANITVKWSWGGSNDDIDGFRLVMRSSSTSTAYTFGAAVGEEQAVELPADRRTFIASGVPANLYYTFFVEAYRTVDKDVATSGVIKSAAVKSTRSDENPYRPAATVNFAGTVTGSIGNDVTIGNTTAAILAGLAQGAVQIDTVAPAAVAGLTVGSTASFDAVGGQIITLNIAWTASSATDLAGYSIEIAQGASSTTFMQVGSVGKTATTFAYSAGILANTVYRVRVSAFDNSANVGNWSTIVNITTARDTAAPAAPTGLTAEAQALDAIQLNWTNPTATDLDHIDIYENTGNASGSATKIATVNASAGQIGGYRRSGLPASAVRYYWLKAVDTSNNASGFSSVATATVSKGVNLTDFDPTLGLVVPQEVASNPTPASWTGSKLIRNTTDGALYVLEAGVWKKAIDMTAISGQVVDTQIATGAVTQTKIGENAVGTAQIAPLAVTAAELANLTVSTAKIANDAISTAKIAPLAVTVAELANLTISDAKIAPNAIIETKIATGAVTNNKVGERAITASKVFIGDTSNMVPDPGFNDQASWTGSAYALSTTTSIFASDYYLRILPTAAAPQQVRSAAIPVEKGTAYAISGIPFGSAANSSTSTISVEWYSDIEATTLIGSAVEIGSSTSTSQTLKTAIVTAPVTARRAKIVLARSPGTSDTGEGRFANIVMRRAATGELIVDGAIIADKLAANSVDATKIVAGSITASKLLIGDTSNIFGDPLMVDPAYYALNIYTLVPTTNSVASTNRLQSPSGTTQQDAYSLFFPVEGGKDYFASCAAWVISGATTGTVYINWYTDTTGGTSISSPVVGQTNSIDVNTRVSTILTAPANARSARFGWRKAASAANAMVGFAEPVMRRATSGELIVDGAIVASKIAAGAVTANKMSVVAGGNVADNQLPAGLFVGSTGDTIAAVQSNANTALTGTAQYRTTGVPTNAPTPTGLTWTDNSNATANIRLDWAAYTQGARRADLIMIFWRKGNAAPTVNDSAVSFPVNSAASYYIFEGISAADTYSFGIAAARRTENGLEVGAIVAPTSPNWRNRGGGTPNFTANIDGTAATTIKAYALDPATVINAASTNIDPGKITIAGAVTLDNWRTPNTTTINGGIITTSTITASKIAIGDTSNMIPDPNMVDIAAWSGTVTTAVASGTYLSTNFLQSQTTTAVAEFATTPIQVEAGKEYFVAGGVRPSTAGTTTSLYVNWFTSSSGSTGLVATDLVGSQSNASFSSIWSKILVAPASARSATVVWQKPASASAVRVEGISPTFRRAASGELIVDGAIVASKIAAGAVTANKMSVVAGGNVSDNQLPNGLFVGTSGDTIGTVQTQAAGAFDGTSGYRVTGVPSNNPTASTITVTANANGTRNIRLDWAAYTQGTRKADLLMLFWRKASTTPTVNDSAVPVNVNTSAASYYIFEGINPTDAMSFGIAAARRTENGIEVGAIQTISAWTNVATATANYTGNINGTAASTIRANALNPASVINAAATNIDPGKITIMGTTTLDNWRTPNTTTIEGGAITANTITANQIAANTITANKLVIGDTANIVDNGWSNGKLEGWSTQNVTNFSPDNGAGAAAGWRIQSIGRDQATSAAVAVTPGETYYMQAWCYNQHGGRANIYAFGNADQTVSGTVTITPVAFTDAKNVWTKVSGIYTVPTGVAALRMCLQSERTAGSGDPTFWSKPVMIRAANSELIVDGAIIGSKIKAGEIISEHITVGTLSGDRIAARSMGAGSLVAGSITVDEMGANSISANQLQANAVTASKIKAGEITGDKINSATSLPASLTISGTGFALGTINNALANATPLATFNALFAAWAGTTPVGWNTWGSQGTLTKVTGAKSANAVRITATANGQNGMVQTGDGATGAGNYALYNSRWIVIEADITLNGGNLQGAGILVRATSGGDTYLNFANDPDVGGFVSGNGNVGQSYSFRKLIATNVGSSTRPEMYLMNHYGGIGSMATANDITWHYAGWRYASEAEINPAKQVNQNSTQIDPGKILISGGTSLASWRNGGDNTKIEGGSIAANTITANKLTLGNRNIGFIGFNFEWNPAANRVEWSNGYIYWQDDNNNLVATLVSAGNTASAPAHQFIYWTKGSATFSYTQNQGLMITDNTVQVAAWWGGNQLNVNYGGTIMHGDRITTGTIQANRLSVNTLSAISADIGTVQAGMIRNAAGTSQFDVTNGRIMFNNGSVMKVSGSGFGTNSQFIEWFGPALGNINQCSESNATSYLRADGSAYFGGALLAGTLRNSNATSLVTGNASTSVGPFGSNGNQIVVVASWSWNSVDSQIFAATAQGRSNYVAAIASLQSSGYTITTQDGGASHDGYKNDGRDSSQFTLSISKSGAAVANEGGVTGYVSIMGIRPEPGDGQQGEIRYTYSFAKSLTYTDPERSTNARTFAATIARNFTPSGGVSIQQRVGINTVE